MPRKLALKRLTASDLTLFKWHYQNHAGTKQKAFNLDTKVLVGQLYPQLGEASLVPNPRVPLDLYLYGPGLAPANNLQRKILKQQKNWRLNGELVDSPVETPELYNVLAPGDFALFEFAGEVIPTTANVVLVASGQFEDSGLHRELARRFPEGSMHILDDFVVQDVLSLAAPPAGHPLYDWADTSLLEDAALGGALGSAEIYARRGSRGVSPEDFIRSRRNAEATGVAGEELLNEWLERARLAGRVREFQWTASKNAVAPYDFWVKDADNQTRLVDAKSTSGGYGNPIHLSLMELKVAVTNADCYDICRLYEVTEGSAKMRIARDIGPSLKHILEALTALPGGVTVDSITLRPDVLKFAPEVYALDMADVDGHE